MEVLVAAIDAPDEISLATQLLEGRGWSVRSREAPHSEPIGAGRRGLLVEVRLHGARFGAVQAAVGEIENLARLHQAGLWVVDAALIEHDLEHDYRTVFHAREKETNAPTRLFGLRALLNSVTVLRIVKQPGRPDAESVAERLESGALTGRPYDPDRLQLHIPTGLEGRDTDASPPDPVSARWRIALPLLTGEILSLGCGFALAAFDGVRILLPLIMTLVLIWPVGRTLLATRGPRPFRTQLAWGAMAVGAATASGFLLAISAPGPPAQAARVLTYAAMGITVLAFVLYGLAYALVHSWFSRNANWAIPALVPALALALPWFGGLLHTVYLRTGFGMPADAAPASLYWRYAASLKPLGAAFAFALLVLAIAGWMRHYHQLVHSRGMVKVGVPLMAIFIVGMSMLAGMAGAQNAAGRAWVAARSGTNPATYYGLEGKLVCVEPLEKKFSVFNGPMDSKRSLLTFGPSGDRVWLWDPRRAESLSVRLEDVVISESTGRNCR
ncbi:hypothetical protein OG453_15055 [Streptomyces sp. NBC_01381]|uniref:hypothetical protein n=1 Tax=Streptomyces sp. NBC_01381 TaxID=2903845 RepID=UPI00224E8762|nr:hypothetical protein [Streptomyces sp. NBC_01381]MCX4667974.1 hypothetical protein [Streptomyces sp. NBC_01381]